MVLVCNQPAELRHCRYGIGRRERLVTKHGSCEACGGVSIYFLKVLQDLDQKPSVAFTSLPGRSSYVLVLVSLSSLRAISLGFIEKT